MTIEEILAALNTHKVRTTYGAVGKLIGLPAIAVAGRLGDRRIEASWVVSASSGRPSGYPDTLRHPELYKYSGVIKAPESLTALITGETDIQSLLVEVKSRPKSVAGAVKTKPRPQHYDLAQIRPGEGQTVLMGVDLAWLSDKNGSGIAIGVLKDRQLELQHVYSGVIGLDNVMKIIDAQPGLSGLAIDAPLIIANQSGSRPCEKALSSVYSPKWAGCHPSNLDRYPNAASVRLAQYLQSNGFDHLGKSPGKWQLECYPHPAIINLFGLDKRLAYKKGTIADKKRGQVQLANYLKGLNNSSRLSLIIHSDCGIYFDPGRIESLSGQGIKDNEDGLDAALCLYIAALYATGSSMECYGGLDEGYIVVPSA
jgi:predicted RNase H-like nuclease